MPKSHWRNPRACQQLSVTRSRPPRELQYSQLQNKLFASVLRIQKRARTNKPCWAPTSEEKGENFQGFVFHLSRAAWNERKRNETDCWKHSFSQLTCLSGNRQSVICIYSLYLLGASLMSVHSIQSRIGWSHCLQVQIDIARKELTESSGCVPRHPLPVWTCCRIAQNAFGVTRLCSSRRTLGPAIPLWLLSVHWGLAEVSRRGLGKSLPAH